VLAANYAEREHDIAEVHREIAEQQVKLRRAHSQARRLSRELRAGNPHQATFEEVQIQIKFTSLHIGYPLDRHLQLVA
jgi:uncharacterized coiled-coil protein SlyX